MLIIICLTAVVLPFTVNTESERCSISDNGKNVDCKKQSLTQVPAFPVMDNIQNLILDNNQITSLTDSSFKPFVNLIKLTINRNNIAALQEGTFHSLSKLEYLKLDKNKITALQEGTFHGLSKLWYLSMKENQLTALPDRIFESSTALRQLYFRKNQIKNLTLGIFDSLTDLRLLFIQDNMIVDLAVGMFDSLTKLKQLALGGNLLTSLPDGIFTSLTKLNLIWLAQNPLLNVPIELFTVVKPAMHLRLPFLCNCTENKDTLLPLIQNVLFETTIYDEKKVAVTSKWIHLTNTCNSTCLDFQECTSKEACMAAETTIYKSTESVSTEPTPMETTGITHYRSTRTESQQLKSETTHYRSTRTESQQLKSETTHYRSPRPEYTRLTAETTYYMSARTESIHSTAGTTQYMSARTESIQTTSMDAEGITYTAVAAIIGAVASAVILYHASQFQMFSWPLDIVKSQEVTRADVEDAVEDMLSIDFVKQDNGPKCTNVPPMSHQDIIWHL